MSWTHAAPVFLRDPHCEAGKLPADGTIGAVLSSNYGFLLFHLFVQQLLSHRRGRSTWLSSMVLLKGSSRKHLGMAFLAQRLFS